MAHLPFGEDFGESGTQEKHHFTSYERDLESGADYAINRQYCQSIGRFNRPDPYSAIDKMSDPQSHNRYTYVHNEPIGSIDPAGLDPFAPGGDWTWNWFWFWSGWFEGPNFNSPPNNGVDIRAIPTCGEWVSQFHFGPDDAKLAEAIFIEFSGDIQEGIAIAFAIKNRWWFLWHTSNTLGFGPRRATLEQVLGASGAFPEYKSDGTLRQPYQNLFDFAWNSTIGAPDGACDKLVKAYTIVSGVNDGGYKDPFAAQGGGWLFQQSSSSPCPICVFLGKLGVHNFWTIPYTDYTGGETTPWY